MSPKDKTSFQIFNTIFKKKKTPWYVGFFSFIQKQNTLFYGTLGFMCLTLVCTLFIFVRTSGSLPFVEKNPLQGNTMSLEASRTLEQQLAISTELRAKTERLAKTYGELKAGQDVTDYPLISTSRSLLRQQTDWTRALEGIDLAIKEVVSGNDILQRITIGNILFSTQTGQIIIENMRIMGQGVSDTAGTGISIAAQLLEALEKSPVFKDVTSSSLEQKVEVSTLGGTQLFTPLEVTMTYQPPFERNDKDAGDSISNEIELLQPRTN